MTFETRMEAEVWVDCFTPDDCDVMIAWLHMAKANMRQWERINAKASRAAKAASGKNEDTKPREIRSAA